MFHVDGLIVRYVFKCYTFNNHCDFLQIVNQFKLGRGCRMDRDRRSQGLPDEFDEQSEGSLQAEGRTGVH